jgi:hypothetical protein
MKPSLTLAWGLLRLPLLGLGLYLLRFQIAELIENTFELWRVMNAAVYFASTFSTRMLVYAGFVLALGFGFWLAGKIKMNTGLRHALTLAVAFVAIFHSFSYLFKVTEPLARAIAVSALLAANTIPYDWLAKRVASGGVLSAVCAAGVGLVEALFPQSYVLWLMGQLGVGDSVKRWSWLAGVIVAPLLWVFILVPFDNQRMLTLGERLHASPSVERFTQGDFNWIEFNPEARLLYAVGRSTNHLLAFDVDNLSQPPRKSSEDIGKTQSFAFNPEQGEIYAYKAETGEVVYLDAETLETIRMTPAPNLSPGDIWMTWDTYTDSIILASEADAEIGAPLIMFDRESGEILATLPLPWIPTNIALHAEEPTLYFNSFKDTYLVSWDLSARAIIEQATTSPRTDRLIYSPRSSEILVASTLEGVILRYDSKTLKYLGNINTSLGDRTMTLDVKRNLLLVGNFINNRLTVIDMDTFEPVESFYLGPWIRTIALDEERGIAYVSTVRNLFRVEYAPSIP